MATNPAFGDLPVSTVNQSMMFPNVPLSDAGQQELVEKCNRFKNAARTHAKLKKQIMRTCYAYNKQKFQGDDLLPRMSTMGNEKDANTGRPQVFVPIIRQEIKRLYAQLKLTLFPNDEDFCRIKGKTEQASLLEEDLTAGFMWLLKNMMFTEKIGKYLQDLCIAGNGDVMPTIKDNIQWEYHFQDAELQPVIDPETGIPIVDPITNQPHMEMIAPPRYVPVLVQEAPTVDVQRLNPLNFYVEPNVQDMDQAKWFYEEYKKLIEILDSNLYFNKEKLKNYVEEYKRSSPDSFTDTAVHNDLQVQFQDVEGNLRFNLYYFPYIELEGQSFRNVLAGIVQDNIVIRFHPSLYPRGMNPVVHTTWMDDPDSPYGTGPAEDIKDIQRLLNIIFNYMIESLSRIGNRFVATPEADLSGLFGVAGGIATTENPKADIVPLSGDYAEPSFLLNLIGTIKADAQITVGSQNPFQGASNIDFKKTATELNILQENSITIMREVIEHIAVTGVAKILERIMYLAADLYKEPVEIRMDDPMAGARFINVDFSVLKSGQFTIELTNINPSQSKQQQVNTLIAMYQQAMANPIIAQRLKDGGYDFLKRISLIMGVTDFDSFFKSQEELAQEAAQQQAMEASQNVQPGLTAVPGSQMGMGASPIPGMG